MSSRGHFVDRKGEKNQRRIYRKNPCLWKDENVKQPEYQNNSLRRGNDFTREENFISREVETNWIWSQSIGIWINRLFPREEKTSRGDQQSTIRVGRRTISQRRMKFSLWLGSRYIAAYIYTKRPVGLTGLKNICPDPTCLLNPAQTSGQDLNYFIKSKPKSATTGPGRAGPSQIPIPRSTS